MPKVSPFPNNASEIRVPPQDAEAEQSVLGAMMLSTEAIRTVIPICKAEDFYREACRTIYRGIVALDDRKEPVDVITLTNELKKRGEFDAVGGISTLTALVERVPTAANAEYYAQIVKEKSASRKLIQAATQVISDAYADAVPIKELLDEAEHRIFTATELRSDEGYTPLKNDLDKGFEYISKVSETKQPVDGIPSGLIDLDQLTGGFQPSNMIVIGARPSVGKTSLGLNIVKNAALGLNILKKKYSAGFFSIEMTKKELALRWLSSAARIDIKKAKAGYLSEADRGRLINVTSQSYDSKVFLNDCSSITVLELKAQARRMKREHNIDFLVVDYLQLVRPGINRDTREQEVSYISSQLKALAKDLEIPVIVMAQLSRPPKGTEARRPALSDLRESGAIEQDADVVIFIHREEEASGDSVRYDYELVVAKQRNGPTDVIPVVFRREYTSFESASQVSEPQAAVAKDRHQWWND